MNEQIRYAHGFSLAEILLSITVLGVIIALALPNYTFMIDKTNAREAVQILDALRKAQISFRNENSTYATNVSNLDVTIPASVNFIIFGIYNDPLRLARVDRNNGTYYFEIAKDGTIACTATSGTLCQRLGCPLSGGVNKCN